MEITPLHHPLLIYPRWRLPYYTTPCSFTTDGDCPIIPPPDNLPLMEITLLHHPSLFTPDGDYPTTPPLLIYPRWGLPYYTTPAHLHRWRLPYYTTPATFTPDGDYPITPPPAHVPQMETTLLHQTGPLLINPRWALPSCTRQAPINLPQMGLPYYTTPANSPQMEITLLHHPCSFTPDGDYPTTPPPAHLPQIEITLLQQTGPLLFYLRWRITLLHQTVPLPNYPRWRLPYYTTPANLPQDGDYPTAPPLLIYPK